MMDPRSWFKDITGYLIYLLTVATIGPLLFGYHLVRLQIQSSIYTLTYTPTG